MSVRVMKYFLALIVFLSVFFIVSNIVNADCYVYLTTCSNTRPAGCTDAMLTSGSLQIAQCHKYTDSEVIPQGSCAVGTTDVCTLGCCCLPDLSHRVSYPGGLCYLYSGAIFDTTHSGYNNDAGCSNICAGITFGATYNISGYVKKNNVAVTGATVTLDGTAKSVVTGTDGRYIFTYIPLGRHSIVAKDDSSCNATQPITITSSNISQDLSLACPLIRVNGYVKNPSGVVVSGAKVNITLNTNGINIGQLTDNNGYYEVFFIPSNSRVDVLGNFTINGATCIGTNGATAGKDNITLNISLSCDSYTVNVGVSSDVSGFDNPTVMLRGQTKNGMSTSFTGLTSGTYTASATWSNTSGNSVVTCSNSTTKSLPQDTSVSLWLGQGTCCNITTTTSQCLGNVQSVTKTYDGTCSKTSEVTTQPCNTRPPCDWICNDWSSCSNGEIQQTRSCPNKNITSSCDPNLPTPPPQVVQSCNPTCGNGILETGESCDYNPYTGDLNVTAACMSTWNNANGIVINSIDDVTPEIMRSICNLNKCSCMQPVTIPTIPQCNQDAGNISALTINPVIKQASFNLNWTMSTTCSAYIDHFELKLCNNDTGECNLGTYNTVNGSIKNDSRTYYHNGSLDPKILPETTYCYNLTVVFNDSVSPENKTKSIKTCYTSGNSTCLGTHLTGWCDGTTNNDKYVCDQKNLISITKCNSDTCMVVNGNATCIKQSPCDRCNGILGLFGYQGYDIDTGIAMSGTGGNYRTVCPSIVDPSPKPGSLTSVAGPNYIYGCYRDYSATSVDEAYNCSNVASCYDYMSEGSCVKDYCQRFNITGNNSCMWKTYTDYASDNSYVSKNIFGKGVCIPINETEQRCDLCANPKYNHLGLCVGSTCGMFGNCKYQYGSSNCMNMADVTCNTYLTESECNGGADVITYVQWDPNNNYDDIYGDGSTKRSGDNFRIKSNDSGIPGGIIGLCKWIDDENVPGSGTCIRDADNNFNNKIPKISDDCATIIDPKLKKLCQKDTIPPTTAIKNKAVYGLNMSLLGQVTIKDNNPWPVADDNSYSNNGEWKYSITYYCVVPSNSASCYPNNVLPVTGTSPYVIDLTKIGFDKRNDSQALTMYYFSEDPARNLEYPIKNFTFKLDALAPNVTVDLIKDSYQISDTQWLTNLSATLTLRNNPLESSSPVSCSFKVIPESDGADVSFRGKSAFNIPLMANPSNNKLDYTKNTLSTSYPSLVDGEYIYELLCTDTLGNVLFVNQSFNVTGNVLIQNATPFADIFVNKASPIQREMNISTSIPGYCKYSDNFSKSFSDMNAFHENSDLSIHYDTINIPNITGIYKYYVACNLSINGNMKLIRGDDMDDPYFSVDNNAPATRLQFKDPDNSYLPKNYNETNKTYEKLSLLFACDDNTPVLTMKSNKSMAFGCNTTMYYCIEKTTDKCLNPSTYTAINQVDSVTLDYTELNSADKQTYGNNPVIHYYSKDLGGNIAGAMATGLKIRNTDLVDPNVTILLGANKNVTLNPGDTINNSYITISISYADETNINITNITLRHISKNIEAPLEILNGTTGNNTYNFRKTYIENGRYILILNATDDDGNVNYNVTYINISHSNNTVYIVSPIVGIGSTPKYNITLSTDYSSDCRYHVGDPISFCPTKECKYNLYSPMKISGQNYHIFEYDSTNFGIRDMFVVCKTLNSLDSSDSSFVNTSFKVGYNSTLPVMNITFIQNPVTRPDDNRIINSSYNAITVRVYTAQPSVCQINKTIDMINHPEQVLINITPPDFFGNEDNTIYNTYGLVHDYFVNYSDRNVYEGVFDYTINCTALSQLSVLNATQINLTPNTPPPVVVINANETHLTLNRYIVNCTGFCNDVYQTKYQFALINQSDSCDGVSTWITMNYTQPIEVRNSSKICARVFDVLGRIGTAEQNVDMVNFNHGKMNITTPYAYYYNIDAYRIDLKDQLYSSTKTFTLNITTPVNATCRYVKEDVITPSDRTTGNLDNIYAIATPFTTTSTDTINRSTHVTDITIYSIENREEVWAVLCLVNNTGSTNPYISRALYLHWDSTAPNFTINFIPPKIYDWTARNIVKINVTTDDDSVCMLNLSKSYIALNVNGVLTLENLNYSQDSILLDTSNITKLDIFDTYDNSRNYTFELPSKWLSNLDYNATYGLNISCWNRAQLATEKNSTLLYDLEHAIKINRTSGSVFNGSNFTINLTTNIISECTVFVDGVSNGLLTTTDGLSHSKNISVTGGLRTINITCVVPTNAGITPGYENFVVTADTDIPVVNLSTSTGRYYTCGLDEFRINVDMTDDTGIDGYAYTISGPDGSTPLNYTTSGLHDVIRYNGTLKDNAAYTVNVRARDIVGKYSLSKSITIIARNSSSSILCDKSIPIMSITSAKSLFLDIVKVSVNCTDDTGCTPTYKYVLTNESYCDNVTYVSSQAYPSQLTFVKSGLLCVRGQDIAGNYGYGSYYVNISVDTSNPLNITPDNTVAGGGMFNYISPNVVVTNQTRVNITLTTALNSVCVYGLTPVTSNNMSDLFSKYFPFNSTGSTAHAIYNFDTKNNYETFMDILCYSAQMSTQQYSRKVLRVIYESSNPTISATINPQLIYDWNSRKSILHISTYPETVCRITGNDTQNTPYLTGNYTDALTYDTDQIQELTFSQDTPSPSTFTYLIDCKTYGSHSNSTTLNLSYTLNNTLGIDLWSASAFNTRNIELLIATNLISDCTLYWNNVSKGGMIANITGRQHYIRVNASADGVYSAEFRCIAPISGIQNSSKYIITINSTTPTTYCGDNITQNPNSAGRAEQCDGIDLAGRTCRSAFAGYNFTGGVLGCKIDCTYDFTNCDTGNGWCGDGRIEHPNSANFDEQCDDNGNTFYAGRNCVDFNANFKGGVLFCNNCMINTSRCLMDNGQVLSTGSLPTCSNKILESGEQCELGQAFTTGCTYFGYTGGNLGCTNACTYDRSGCYITATVPSGGGTCGNGALNTGEQCDGTRGLSNVSCSDLGNYSGGNVSCTNRCTYDVSQCIGKIDHCVNGVKDPTESDKDCGGDCLPCALNKTCIVDNDCTSKKCSANKCIVNPCTNGIFDSAFETDKDCGNTCAACGIGKNCVASSDCSSGFCINNKCSEDPCSNGLKDPGELDTDCGGSCALCGVGKHCVTSSDCSTDSCVNGLCAEKVATNDTSGMKMILMIAGILLTLGSGGYITYKSFNNNNNNSGQKEQMMGRFGNNTGPEISMKPEYSQEQKKLMEKQREAMMKKRQERTTERKSLIQSLDSEGKKESSTSGKTILKEDEDGLKKIAVKEDSEEFVDLSSLKSKRKQSEGQSLATSSGNSKNVKDKEDAFAKLKEMKIDDVATKIAKLSGSNKEDIAPTLERADLSHVEALKMFGKLDRDMIMSNVFREILSKLLASGKISKSNVSNILFEYMDKGLLNKGDVAKISSDLKII